MNTTGVRPDYPVRTRPMAYEMSHVHRLDVARLMARLKPDWWDVREALQELIENSGWCLLDGHGSAMGWLIARQYPSCRSVEIENLGYDRCGQMCIGEELEPLVAACEDWGLYSGMANCRYIISSAGLSIHNHEIKDPVSALASLVSVDRPDYDWFVSMGYQPFGILPQIYGYRYHGIILLKEMSFDARCPDKMPVL